MWWLRIITTDYTDEHRLGTYYTNDEFQPFYRAIFPTGNF